MKCCFQFRKKYQSALITCSFCFNQSLSILNPLHYIFSYHLPLLQFLFSLIIFICPFIQCRQFVKIVLSIIFDKSDFYNLYSIILRRATDYIFILNQIGICTINYVVVEEKNSLNYSIYKFHYFRIGGLFNTDINNVFNF